MFVMMHGRGIGIIPNSGLQLNDDYAFLDAEKVLPIQLENHLLILKAVNVGAYYKD